MLTTMNEIKLNTLMEAVAVSNGKKFTIYYQTRFASNMIDAYAAYDGQDVMVKLGDYTRLTEIRALDMEDAWMKMQGEMWSPMGEARSIIRELGLSHTSMSVGDLLQDEEGTFYIVAPVGFKKVRATV